MNWRIGKTTDVLVAQLSEHDGKIPNFTGINSPYEPPEQPELVVSTETDSLLESVESILRLLVKGEELR